MGTYRVLESLGLLAKPIISTRLPFIETGRKTFLVSSGVAKKSPREAQLPYFFPLLKEKGKKLLLLLQSANALK